MFKEGPPNTALITAAARAMENEHDNPLVKDPYAKLLAGEEGIRLLDSFNEAFVLVESIRTKFFDDAILEAAKNGKRQFVVLGAGLDTRPYRLGFPEGSLWMEVDFASILEYKRRLLKEHKASAKIVDLPMDVAGLDVQRDLVPGGFDPERQSVWVAEGLLPYLSDGQVETLLSLISAASAPGSELLITSPNRAAIVPSNYTKQRYEFMSRINAQWRFSGTDKPDELIGRHGYRTETVFVGHRKAHYGMLPVPPMDSLPQGVPTDWYIKGVRA